MKITRIRQASIAIVLIIAAASACAADAELLCEPDGDCTDPCVYFPKDVTFHAVGYGALLSYEGVVYKLKRESKRVLRRSRPIAELPGHTTVTNYSHKELRVELKSIVGTTSCFEKNARGVYEDTGKCCGGKNHMQLKVTKGSKTKVYSSKWDWGC